MPFFTCDGLAFHYRDLGSGTTFFFQHGLGADSSQPFSLFAPPPRFRLLAFDVRAHGETRPLGDPAKLCFRVFAEDLLALMNHLDIERAIVGGISMGAALALHFTLRFPERVIGLVLSRPAWLEGPCPWNVKMFALISRLIRTHGGQQGLIEFQKTPEYDEARQKWPEVASSLSNQFLHPRAQETVSKFERIINDRPHPDRKAWSRVKVPTLVLGNRVDPIHPFEYAEELARAIPSSELREITSKSVSLERHNAEVQRCLEEFLKGSFQAGALQR